MKFVVTYIFLFCATFLFAQTPRFIFLELGGSGGLASLNYEHSIHYRIRNHTGWGGDDGIPKMMYTYRIGVSSMPVDRNNGWDITFPLMANALYGKEFQQLECGAGFAPSITTRGSWFVRSPLMFGYRHESKNNKLFLRFDYTPIVSWLLGFQWEHWAGFSIGYFLI